MFKKLFSQYTAAEAERASLYHLSAAFKFLGHSESELLPNCYRFKRRDGVSIDYYETVRDCDLGSAHLHRLADYLQNLPTLEPKKLIIAPVVLVDRRSHFNTLVIYSDEHANKHVYVLEPRSSTFSLGLFRLFYPVQRMIDAVLAVVGIRPQYLTVGTQPLLDDVTCGPQHVNFVEMVSKLDDATLKNPKRFMRMLKITNLASRLNDQENIEKVRQANPRVSEGAFPEVVASNNNERLRELNRELTLSIEKKDALISRLGLRFLAYKSRVPVNFNLFGAHTRQATADGLYRMVNALMDSPEAIETKLYKAALLGYAAFTTNKSSNSSLRNSVGEGLAAVLNCEAEYKKLLEQKPNHQACIDFFRHRLALLRMQSGIQFGQREARQLFRTMKHVNDNDSSLQYRFGRRDAIDQRRKESFARISQLLNIDVVEPDVQQGLRA